METVSVLVSRDVDACWRVFTDVALLTSWVPGLRSAEILTIERGLPAEIHFEHGSLAYTLVYSYDRPNREVRWQPKLGKQAGVTGFARFVPEGTDTRVMYGLELGESRTTEELQPLVESFARRVYAEP